MKSISNLGDLREYGIEILTGEADNLTYRILMNVQLSGYKLLCEVYGLPYSSPDQVPDPDNKGGRYRWNYHHAGRTYLRDHPPGWAEAMNDGVTCWMMQEHDLHMIAPVALVLRGGCHTILSCQTSQPGVTPGTHYQSWQWFGLENEERYWVEERKVDGNDWEYDAYVDLGRGPQKWPNIYGRVMKIVKASQHPHRGTRNIHGFSGRSV